jgi:predicted nucleic-acid-binding protein
VIALDTNVLVRYLVQDDEGQVHRATAVIESELSQQVPGFISLVSMTELIWVLTRQYGLSLAFVKVAISELLNAPNIVIEEAELVEKALAIPHNDISDIFIHLVGQSKGCTKTVTFDKKFARVPGVELLTV